MNSNIITLIISFFIIVLAQVFLFNNMFIFGFINPMIYLLFLVLYRFDDDQTLFILLSFVLGFSIDFLSQSGGAHTIASLTIGFVRPLLIKYSFGVTSEAPSTFQNDLRRRNKYLFLALLILIHHLLYFIIVYFNWNATYLILKNTILTSLFSLILIALISRFYKKLNDT